MQRQAKLSLDKRILQNLSRRTALPWMKDAVLDWAVILGALGVVHLFSNPVTWLLALLIIGNRQHALAILGHDGTHFTLSRNRRLNDHLTNLIAFWPIGLTVSGYRTLHFKHHRHAGTEDDPELGHKRSRSPQWDLPAKPSRILKYALLDIVGGSLPDYLIILKYSKPDKRSEYLPLLCFHAVAITLLAVSELWWAGLLWYAGLVTTFMMSFRLRLWLEHQGTPDTHRLYLNFWQALLLAPHNSWMHWEHHAWPSIPYHRLAEVRRHDTEKPVWTLGELLQWFKHAEHMSSGQVVALKHAAVRDRQNITGENRERQPRFFGHSCIAIKKHLLVALRLSPRRYSGRLGPGRSDSGLSCGNN
jgi:fatty acid desaturase